MFQFNAVCLWLSQTNASNMLIIVEVLVEPSHDLTGSLDALPKAKQTFLLCQAILESTFCLAQSRALIDSPFRPPFF